MIASVRWAPSFHWEGSEAEVRESVPRTRMLTAGSSPAATFCCGARAGMPAKGSAMNSMPEAMECRTHRARPPVARVRTRKIARTLRRAILHPRPGRRRALPALRAEVVSAPDEAASASPFSIGLLSGSGRRDCVMGQWHHIFLERFARNPLVLGIPGKTLMK